MSIILTIVVPLFNAGERFIPFLDSLIGQSVKDIEVIIVNDGSSDGSGKIAHEYASQYDFIQVIDQENGGVSVARNVGIKMAAGKYIAFPDADDVLDPNIYSTLLSMAEKDNLDVAQCNGVRCCGLNKKNVIFPYERLASSSVITGGEWLERALKSRRFIHVVWLCIYNLEFIKVNNVNFYPGLHHQDILWTTEVMYNASRVRYIDTPLYYQNIHGNSVSNRRRTGLNNVVYQRHYIIIIKKLVMLNKKYSDVIAIKPAFHWQITREALSICHSVRRENDLFAKKLIVHDFYSFSINKIMIYNARGIRQLWQVILWLYRLNKVR